MKHQYLLFYLQLLTLGYINCFHLWASYHFHKFNLQKAFFWIKCMFLKVPVILENTTQSSSLAKNDYLRSLHVRNCISYIDDNLHYNQTVTKLQHKLFYHF